MSRCQQVQTRATELEYWSSMPECGNITQQTTLKPENGPERGLMPVRLLQTDLMDFLTVCNKFITGLPKSIPLSG